MRFFSTGGFCLCLSYKAIQTLWQRLHLWVFIGSSPYRAPAHLDLGSSSHSSPADPLKLPSDWQRAAISPGRCTDVPRCRPQICPRSRSGIDWTHALDYGRAERWSAASVSGRVNFTVGFLAAFIFPSILTRVLIRALPDTIMFLWGGLSSVMSGVCLDVCLKTSNSCLIRPGNLCPRALRGRQI